MLRTMNEDGKTFAIIPIQEYNKIMQSIEDEDLADIMAYDMAKALNEESFPMQLFKDIEAGASPVKTFRNYRKLSGKTVAELAGISEAYLSQIESGTRKGTGKTIKAIAKVLNVDLDMLIE